MPVLVALVLVALLASTAALADTESARREAELKALRERVAELDRAQLGDQRHQDRLRRDIEAAEKSLAAAVRALRLASAQVAEQQREVEQARDEQARALKQADARREDLARALRASYMAGQPGRLQLMLGQDPGAGHDRLDADASVLAGALQQQVRDLQATIAQLRIAETVLGDEQRALEARRREQQQQLGALEQAQKARRVELEKLRQRTLDRQTEVARARAEQARVEKLLESLRQALRDSPMKYERGTPFKSQRGRLPWPLRGKLLAGFGSPKNGGPLNWSGWWIGATEGTAVRAVADARVVYVGWLQRYGQLVILDHAGPYLTLYGHLQEAVVEVGETVDAGTQLGTAGSSGGHDHPGLYFEIRQGTNAVDPRPWLAR